MIDEKTIQRYRNDAIFNRLSNLLADVLISEAMTLEDLKESVPQALLIAIEKYEHYLDDIKEKACH